MAVIRGDQREKDSAACQQIHKSGRIRPAGGMHTGNTVVDFRCIVEILLRNHRWIVQRPCRMCQYRKSAGFMNGIHQKTVIGMITDLRFFCAANGGNMVTPAP